MPLKPEADVRKFFISTPSRFRGEFEHNDELLITEASLITDNFEKATLGSQQGPFSRNYYVLAFRLKPEEKAHGLVPLNPGKAEATTIVHAMTVLYGKRVDLHEPFECFGHYCAPFLGNLNPVEYTDSGPLSHSPRKDLEVPLNLSEMKRITPMLFASPQYEVIGSTFSAAAHSYAKALQSFDTQPEDAYLDLITCGEILSGHLKHSDEVMIEKNLLDMLATIREKLPNGDEIAKAFRSRLWQVKRRFVQTLMDLLNENFFAGTETNGGYGALTPLSFPYPTLKSKQLDLRARLKAAYDVRSAYVHTGSQFGFLIRPDRERKEVQIGGFTSGMNGLSADFAKIMTKAPTFLGLERVIRYALLRFMQTNGVEIDSRLSGNGLVDAESPSPVPVASTTI